MIQISIDTNINGRIKEISFRISKNQKILKLIITFLKKYHQYKIKLKEIKGWYYKITFTEIYMTYKIIKEFVIELYKIIIYCKIIEVEFELILTLPRITQYEKIINYLNDLPFQITSTQRFLNIRSHNLELILSLTLSLIEISLETSQKMPTLINPDILKEFYNQRCINFNSPQNNYSCMNINKFKKNKDKDSKKPE